MTTQSTGFEILTFSPITGNIDSNRYGTFINPSKGHTTVDVQIHSVKRESDGEVFTLGDRVSNDLIKGKITEFHVIEGELYVQTTGSATGMHIIDIHRIQTLPSKYQEGDKVRVNYFGTCLEYGWVHRVHFTKNKVTYDVEIIMPINGKTENFRMYNVDSVFVEDRTDNNQ